MILEREFINDILDDMTWSFSRLNSFYNCRRGWYCTYILKKQGKDNFFSQYGTFCHSIFEKYNNGEIEIFELSDFFEKNYYQNITMYAPPNKYVDLNDSYFKKGLNCFLNFNGYEDKCLGAEVPFEIIINVLGKDRKFIGYIDRVSRDEHGIIVSDYKSKSKFKNKEELEDYARQMYFYAIAVKEIYGEYPYKLIFDLFNSNQKVEIEFSESGLSETLDWINDTFSLIYNESEFLCSKNDFFCNYLCSTGLDYCENI